MHRPGRVTGGGSFGSAAAVVNAVFTTGHGISNSRAACHHRPSAVGDRFPGRVRNRDRDGIDGSASVNVLRRHCSLTHCHRRQVQVRRRPA
ncbi:hypothetical protein [Actinomadura sp. DC4]|uniref:hypothetical protein n=1 Tax=Actinomadura sp. DC4 TaxID=3055069 RepID=UPI0025B23D1C|nr:hypothetical protein [Actinomadura sp. DC4]MDN3357783.1 hypothetical protein [Actinomadura sp. DC4]